MASHQEYRIRRAPAKVYKNNSERQPGIDRYEQSAKRTNERSKNHIELKSPSLPFPEMANQGDKPTRPLAPFLDGGCLLGKTKIQRTLARSASPAPPPGKHCLKGRRCSSPNLLPFFFLPPICSSLKMRPC